MDDSLNHINIILKKSLPQTIVQVHQGWTYTLEFTYVNQ